MTQWTGQPQVAVDDGYAMNNSPTKTFSNTDVYSILGNLVDTSAHSFYRYPNVTVPQGSSITSAYLHYIAYENGTNDNCNVTIYANDVDNVAAAPTTWDDFATIWQNAGGQLTSASVNWGPLADWVASNEYDTDDIKTVIQEIISRAGWASGNGLMIVVKDNASSNDAKRYFEAAWTSSPRGPTLEINYTAGTTPLTPILSKHFLHSQSYVRK